MINLDIFQMATGLASALCFLVALVWARRTRKRPPITEPNTPANVTSLSAAYRQQLADARLMGTMAAVSDARTGNTTPNPYKPGGRAHVVWTTSYAIVQTDLLHAQALDHAPRATVAPFKPRSQPQP